MNASEPDSRMVGVRVLAADGPREGDTGVVTMVNSPQWIRIQWDNGENTAYHADDVITETQALGNVDVIR